MIRPPTKTYKMFIGECPHCKVTLYTDYEYTGRKVYNIPCLACKKNIKIEKDMSKKAKEEEEPTQIEEVILEPKKPSKKKKIHIQKK